MRIDWHKHISVDREIHHGEPCINGARIPVSMIVGSVADGMSFEAIMDAYPQLNRTYARRSLIPYPSPPLCGGRESPLLSGREAARVRERSASHIA